MSLTDEQRRTIVSLELEKARDAYKATEKFYRLSKADRDAVIKFIEAI